jgi:hypothetical protein
MKEKPRAAFALRERFGEETMRQELQEEIELILVHDYAEHKDGCAPGEEVVAAILGYCGRRCWIPWGPTHLILIDLICRHRRIPLDAQAIANKMQTDPFVLQYSANAPCFIARPARTSRTAVRQQIKRIRDVLAELIENEGLGIDAWDIISSVETSTRAVRYRINAKVSWKHWTGSEGEDSGACILLSAPRPTPPGSASVSVSGVLT